MPMANLILNLCPDQQLPLDMHISTHQKTALQTTQLKNMDKGLEYIFLQKNIHMANKHMKIFSISLVTREMQIKTTIR